LVNLNALIVVILSGATEHSESLPWAKSKGSAAKDLLFTWCGTYFGRWPRACP